MESNHVRDFVPSIRNHCETEQAEAEAHFVSRQAILDSEQTLPLVIDEMMTQVKSLRSLKKLELIAEQDNKQLERERIITKEPH